MTLILNARVKLNISEKHLDCQYPYKKNRFTYLCIHMYPDDDVRIYKHNYVERDRGQIGKLAWQEWTRKKKLTQQHDSWVDLLFLLLSSPSVLFHISALYVYISSCPLRLFSVWLLHSTLGKKYSASTLDLYHISWVILKMKINLM